MAENDAPLILTLHLDDTGQAFFDQQRMRFFPAERDLIKAHLTLFHQLPATTEVYQYLSALPSERFKMAVTGLMDLGSGVAYRIESRELLSLHRKLSAHFADILIPQDRHCFRPHVVIQNKVSAEQARTLLEDLSPDFQPFEVSATGLDLWAYLGGPWRHMASYSFDGISF